MNFNWSSGNWIQTYTGLQVYPFEMKTFMVDIEDVAHALSNVCRFTGHCKNFYSVAQHSIYASLLASPENKLWGLLHDASEAYICDMSHPIKNHPSMAVYRGLEEDIMRVICQKFCLSPEMPKEIQRIDGMLVSTEAAQLGLKTSQWKNMLPELEIKIVPWSPVEAEDKFLSQYYRLVKI